jgi:hypothetical protein
MPELITASTGAPHGKGRLADLKSQTHWQIATPVDVVTAVPVESFNVFSQLNIPLHLIHQVLGSQRTIIALVVANKLINTDTSYTTLSAGVFAIDVSLTFDKPNHLHSTDTHYSAGYFNTIPAVDNLWQLGFRSVDRFFNKPPPPLDNKYHPSRDFSITAELIGFTNNFDQPLDFDKVKTALSPIDSVSAKPWNRNRAVDVEKAFKYGYSINKFIVGGGARVIYPVDEDAVTPEPDAPIKVIKIVNNVSIVTLPDRTPLNFDGIQLARQIDAFAWSADVTLLDQASFDLVKPSTSATVDIEISVNGTAWVMFVAKGSKSQAFGEQNFSVKAFSKSALLQDLYAGKISFTNSSNTTPASLINDLISSYGFTSVWDLTPSWTINQGQFSVQNKSPIDAVATVANSIGAVIEPDLLTNIITIKPWCETTPWTWSGLTGLPQVDANLSYNFSEDYSPQAQANAIYVTGQENGIATKCVINGTAGDVLLPSVSDPLITDTAAAGERGRIELAKSGHKENVPLTSFIDENETLLMPGNMITINNTQAEPWNGMVTQTSISVSNQGLEVYQTLSVLRHYD